MAQKNKVFGARVAQLALGGFPRSLKTAVVIDDRFVNDQCAARRQLAALEERGHRAHAI